MRNLSNYINKIHANTNSEYVSQIYITRRELSNTKVKDKLADYTTQVTEEVITFNNGVIIKKSLEEDDDDIKHYNICKECFIDYSVISEPMDLDIRPKNKRFTNKCQEKFWLKIQSIQI